MFEHLADFDCLTEKFLPALKCLTALQKLEPGHAQIKGFKERLEAEVAKEGNALPEKVDAVFKDGLKEIKA